MSKDSRIMRGSLIAAIFSGIVASLCCLGPFVLLSLGVGTAFVGTLTQLAFLRPVAIVVAIVFLGLSFWKLYIKPKSCSKNCSYPCISQQIIFWLVVLFVMTTIIFPWIVSFF